MADDPTVSTYSFRALLAQSPEKIKNWFLTVGAVGVIVATSKGYVVDGAFVAAVGLAIERTLDLVYVAPVRQAQNEAAALVAFENVALNAAAGPAPAPVVPPVPPDGGGI